MDQHKGYQGRGGGLSRRTARLLLILCAGAVLFFLGARSSGYSVKYILLRLPVIFVPIAAYLLLNEFMRRSLLRSAAPPRRDEKPGADSGKTQAGGQR
jgi:hypothetical protein